MEVLPRNRFGLRGPLPGSPEGFSGERVCEVGFRMRASGVRKRRERMETAAAPISLPHQHPDKRKRVRIKMNESGETRVDNLKYLNFIITLLFFVCYSYQLFYIPVPWLFGKKKKSPPTDMHHRYAVLICARNEERVIGDLIGSLHRQTYDIGKLTIFVMADNCTDNTAAAARAAGATVYERQDPKQVGKGYALSSLMEHLASDYPEGFDGYFVFDADNILREDYVEKMDRVFSDGHEIVTSYRNSKNYGSNWISAGCALWFLRESRYLNHARYLLGTSCAVSGTGFLFSRRIALEMNGWPFHMLTEDIEFSVHQITRGRKIAFCAEAELFDEQPVSFSQSWRQRMRWSRGFLQVFRGYGFKLVKGIFRGSFSCFDMAMNTSPAFILSIVSIILNLFLGIRGACKGDDVMIAVQSLGEMIANVYLSLFAVGLVTTITEWKRIHASPVKKIVYLFTFPLYMFTYMPISIAALFVNPGWKPISHSKGFRIPESREAQETENPTE